MWKAPVMSLKGTANAASLFLPLSYSVLNTNEELIMV